MRACALFAAAHSLLFQLLCTIFVLSLEKYDDLTKTKAGITG